MATLAMTGQDTIKVNGRNLTDLPDGDVAVLTFPNDLAAVKTGKNGNSIYALNESGKQAELVLRLIRGSSDDKFMNNLRANMKNNFPSFVLMDAEFVKQLGDGSGKVTKDVYIT